MIKPEIVLLIEEMQEVKGEYSILTIQDVLRLFDIAATRALTAATRLAGNR